MGFLKRAKVLWEVNQAQLAAFSLIPCSPMLSHLYKFSSQEFIGFLLFKDGALLDHRR